jgi:Lrp/AsnC family transcriptional regulator of ectoine degradation
MKKQALDAIDLKILSALQSHGHLSKARLAELVHLSPTPCWARLDRLKAAGLVRGFQADIALDRLVDTTQVVMTVSLAEHRKINFDRFERFVAQRNEVVECFTTGGGTDYVLKLMVLDLAALKVFLDLMLDAELNIDRYYTYFITREVKKVQPDLLQLMAAKRSSLSSGE